MRLDVRDDTTVLQYDVGVRDGGKLSQPGSRIIDGFAKNLADEFCLNFKTAVEGPEHIEEQAVENASSKGWFTRLTSGKRTAYRTGA